MISHEQLASKTLWSGIFQENGMSQLVPDNKPTLYGCMYIILKKKILKNKKKW